MVCCTQGRLAHTHPSHAHGPYLLCLHPSCVKPLMPAQRTPCPVPAGAPVVVELTPDPAAPAAAAYPNTLPAAAALFGTAEALRYSHLLEQLQVRRWGS